MSRIAVLVASLLALLVPAPVRAAFHIAVIDEVMSGVNNGTTHSSSQTAPDGHAGPGSTVTGMTVDY